MILAGLLDASMFIARFASSSTLIIVNLHGSKWKAQIRLFSQLWLIVLLTSAAQARLPSLIDLRETDADVEILGATNLNTTGKASTVGDFNGDGFPDLVIASPSASPLGRDRVGEVDILWGRASFDSLIDLSSYSGEITRIIGKLGEKAVQMELNAGDHNKDGYDDLAIGLPLYPFPWGDGKVYVIFGSEEFPDTLDLQSPSVEVMMILGFGGGLLGRSMTAGDIDGDTYQDFVVSAPAAPSGGGEVYIINGRDSFPGTMNMSIAPPGVTRIIDPAEHQATGRGLACGDVNSDGYDDLLVGSPGSAQGYYQGKGTLLFGTGTMPDTILLSEPSLSVKRILPEYDHGQLGWRVAIGDINRDEYQDLIIAAPMADPFACGNCGEIYVIHGSDTIPDTIDVGSNETPITYVLGSGTEQKYGHEIICGDVTRDQYDDIIISSYPDPYNSADAYKVTILYGESSLPDTVFLGSDTTVTRILGEGHDDLFGSAPTCGNLGGEDAADLVLGAYYADPLGRNNAGKVYLFFGIGGPTGIAYPNTPRILFQNYPNPFSSNTVIEYMLKHPSHVDLIIYNVMGQRVVQFTNSEKAPGPHAFIWNGLDNRGRAVASGVYFYQLRANGLSQTKKMLLLR